MRIALGMLPCSTTRVWFEFTHDLGAARAVGLLP